MNPLFFFIAVKKLLSCSPYFFNVEGPVTFVTLSKARALRARSIQRFLPERRNSCFQDGAVSSAWLVLLSARKWGLWLGDLKHVLSLHAVVRWSFLLDAFAPWFSWHQRLTCRQAAAFPGSDLGASELVVSSRVPKCLHRIGSFGPPKRGSKSKASNQAAFIGLSCAVPARGR